MESFRDALNRRSSIDIVQRYITFGNPTVLSQSQHVELKQRIATAFGVHHTDVLVVGSAKLGFSIAPHKRWKAFGETSDVDVAIVSRELYEKIWHQVSLLLVTDPYIRWPKKQKYAEHQLHGWMRPDLLPSSPSLPLADDWFEFFRGLTSEGCCGPYKISAGLYYDVHFLERYQSRAVEMCVTASSKDSRDEKVKEEG